MRTIMFSNGNKNCWANSVLIYIKAIQTILEHLEVKENLRPGAVAQLAEFSPHAKHL